jgi:phenylalanyl-tRNA synthetase beta subunit
VILVKAQDGNNHNKQEEHVVGTFGILHPEVLKAYEIGFPTSAVELDLEPLMLS